MSRLNENSMLFWYPKIQNLGIPIPKTIFTHLDTASVKKAASTIGYPVFIRTDLCSGKHDWLESCYVTADSDLDAHLKVICNANRAWELIGVYYEAFVVREFLDLKSSFTAFAGGMPINRERRYFIKDGKVLCRHPYWPETAFNRHPARMANDDEWKQKLEELNTGFPEILDDYAIKVSNAIEGYWSVDFAQANNDVWYLLDMALGYNSYHWPNCDKRI